MANVMKIDISSGAIFRVVLILLGFWFLYIIRDIVFMLFAAVVISSAIEPVANYFQRYRVPRAISVLVVYILLLAIVSAVVTLMVPPLAAQVGQLAQGVPTVIDQFDHWVGLLGLNEEVAVAQLQDALNRFGEQLGNVGVNIFQQTRNVFSGLFTFLFVLIIAFYLVIEKDALKKFFRLILPRKHIAYTDRVVERIQQKIGRWVVAQFVLGIIIGVIVGLGLWALGVQYALVLGLLAGIMEIIPVIGPIIAAVPGVFVALSQGWVLGLATLVFYILVQQAENHLLVPNIMRKAVGLSPLVTLIAVLLGARLAGVGGVILAVPLATILSIFLSDLFDRTDV